jgi:putative ABC transport system ATP-binding protein
MRNTAIEAHNLSKSYQRGSETIYALKDVSFTIPEGEFVSIVGPSGSGKTTLLNLIGCLDTATGGTISVNGREVSGIGENRLVKIRRDAIGFVFQQFFLLPTLSVKDNIALPLLFSGKNHAVGKIRDILGLVGLEKRADHLPHQLSGGEMQRVAIGRALINSPKIILADEPTGNLDSVTSQKIYDLFQDLRSRGLTLIIVTHNMDLAKMAHGMISLKDGSIIDISPQLKLKSD